MKRGILVGIALFLLVLPICNAAYIHSINVTGKHGLPNIFDTDDTKDGLTFISYIVDESPDPNSISLYFPRYNTEFPFANCNAKCTNITEPSYPANTYKCTCVTDWAPDSKMPVIFKYKGFSLTTEICPDNKPPKITFTTSQKNGKLLVDYTIVDIASTSCPNLCAGIKDVKIFTADKQLFTKEYNTLDCSVKETLELNYSVDGESIIFIETSDNMHESNEDSHFSIAKQTFNGDFTNPTITDLKLTKQNKNIEYIGPKEIQNVNLSFKIQEDNLRSISVKLSSIGSNSDITSSPEKYCKLNQIWLCNFLVSLKESNIELEVTAKDDYNEKTTILKKTIQEDNDPPILTNLYSKFNTDDISYVKKLDNTIIAEITEEKSGLNENNIYLDLSSMGFSHPVKATNCTNNKCFFENIDIKTNSKKYLITPHFSSEDDVGNKLQSNIKSLPIVFDDESPTLESIEIYSVTGIGEVTFHQSGDILKIITKIKDNNGVSEALLNASELLDTNTIINGACQTNNTISTCIFETSAIKSGYYKANLYFKILDVAGNPLQFTKDITVFGVLDETPDIFHIETGDTIPEAINRLTVSLLPNPPGYKLLVPFALKSSSTSTKVLHYTINSCKAENSTVAFENFFLDSNNPTKLPLKTIYSLTQNNEINYMELIFRQLTGNESQKINTLNLDCDIDIYVRRGTRIFAHPEKEHIKFKIKFSNSSISGDPADKIIKKIDDAKGNLAYKLKFATSASNFFKKMESLCQKTQQIVSMWGAFGLIESAGSLLEQSKIPGVKHVGEGIFYTGCYMYEITGQFLVMPIWYGKSPGKSGFSPGKCSDKFKSGETAIGDRKIEDLTSHYVGENLKLLKSDKWLGMRWICDSISCRYGTHLSEQLQKSTGAGLFDKLKDKSHINLGSFGFIDLTQQGIPLDPKDNLVMSVTTACIPGIFQNLDKYRQIQCHYIHCLQDSAMAGGDISLCEKIKDEGLCIAWFGEFTKWIGAVNLMDNIADQTVKIASNLLPNGLKAVFDKAICHQDKAGQNKFAATALCDIPRYYYAFKDNLNTLKSLNSMTKKSSWTMGSNYEDACKDVK